MLIKLQNMKSLKQTLSTVLLTLLFKFTYGCDVPTGFTLSHITASTATVSWSPVSGASSYKILYRIKGTTTWTTLLTNQSSKVINGLNPATRYQYKLKSVCGNAPSLFSKVNSFSTLAVFNVPTPDHVVVLILENHAYSEIIGSPAAPYINGLVNDSMSALFTASYGLTHPSQPNYIYLFSGANQGVVDNNMPVGIPFTTANLARQLIDAGKTFKTYSEGLPSIGYDSAASGAYVRKHNPVANWMGAGINQVAPNCNHPFTAFPTSNFASLPTVSFVVPDQNNNMHDGASPANITVSDSWIYTNLNSYIQWAKMNNSLFILTFDEDNSLSKNHIATIFNGAMVHKASYSNRINHYNILRTIEDMYGLPYAGNAASSSPITYCWKATPKLSFETNSMNDNFSLDVFPNPTTSSINIVADGNLPLENQLIIYDFAGEKVFEKENISTNETLDISKLAKGNYILKIISKTKNATKKFEKE